MVSQKHYVFKNMHFLEITPKHWKIKHNAVPKTLEIHVVSRKRGNSCMFHVVKSAFLKSDLFAMTGMIRFRK